MNKTSDLEILYEAINSQSRKRSSLKAYIKEKHKAMDKCLPLNKRAIKFYSIVSELQTIQARLRHPTSKKNAILFLKREIELRKQLNTL